MRINILPLFIASASLGFAQGTTQTILPYGLEIRDGNRNDALFMGTGERQEWIRASYLSQALTTPVLISEVGFRVAGGSLAYSGIMPHIEIWMTTTQTEWQDLGFLWSMNQRADAAQVYAADNVVLNSPGGPGPNAFGLRFTFSQPFYYDPRNGNLLMRVVTDSGQFAVTGSRFIDAEAFPLENPPIASVGYADVGGGPAPRGPVVEFSWSPVPEPSTTALWSGAILFYLIAGRKS